MFMHRIKLKNILSFGPDGQELELKPLNVLIGPNGSGKSNLIEVIGLLRAAPADLLTPIREGGGVRDWLWRGEQRASYAQVDAVVDNPRRQQALHYLFSFAERAQWLELKEEIIANEFPFEGHLNPYLYFQNTGGRAFINFQDISGEHTPRELRREDVRPDQSILAQRKDPDHYPY